MAQGGENETNGRDVQDGGPTSVKDIHRYSRHKKRERRRLRIKDFRGLEPWKRYLTLKWALIFVLVGVGFLVFACVSMHSAASSSRAHYFDASSEHNQSSVAVAQELADQEGATHVLTGTYLENVSSIDLKDSSFSATFLVWFRWDGTPGLDMIDHFSIYKGSVDSIDLLAQEDDGDTHYQLARVSATITKDFDTTCFPLSQQQCNIYLESE